MVVPVSPVLPDSTLSPHQVNQKFHSSAMAGLGDCWDYDDMGQCLYDPDASGSIPIPAGIPPVASYASDLAITTLNPMSSGPTVTGAWMNSSGALIMPFDTGGWMQVNRDGSSATVHSGSPPSSSQVNNISAAQANMWPSIINSLANAGVRIATVANLPAGASLMPNGTIVGSGQSLIRPGVITSNTLTSALSALTSSPMLMIGGFGLLAILLLSGGRR